MNKPVLKILFGPPGTGKTWQAAREAVRIVMGEVDPSDFADVHRKLVQEGTIIWVTFHPSYSYEDFVEGFRPESTNGGVTYVSRPGPFKSACAKCRVPYAWPLLFTRGQHLKSTTLKIYEVVDVEPGALIVKNVKGRGEGLYTPVSFWLIERLRGLGYKPGDLSIPGKDHDKKQVIAERVEVDMQTLFAMTGPMRAVWEYIEEHERAAREASPVVLVIDEINRADLSRVFGELMTLLETDKRIGAKEERRIVLPYSRELFGVPATLSIIGTMNTADRSLAVMDVALRRRFDFQEVPPEPEKCANPYGGVELPRVLMGWNRRISALLSRDQRIGHSHLMTGRLEEVRSANGFAGDDDGQLRAIAATIRANILPLLVEYFHDDWRKVDLVLGRDYARNKGGLLETILFDDLSAVASDVVDLDDASDFRAASFWDPFSRSGDWDAERFRNALASK